MMQGLKGVHLFLGGNALAGPRFGFCNRHDFSSQLLEPQLPHASLIACNNCLPLLLIVRDVLFRLVPFLLFLDFLLFSALSKSTMKSLTLA